MKNLLYLTLVLLFISCKHQVNNDSTINLNSDKKTETIPDLNENTVQYSDNKNHNNSCIDISKKLKDSYGNFLGDTDENDIYGHPDTDYDNLTIWDNPELNREEIYFNAKTISKEYIFFIENNILIAALEGKVDDEGVFKGDSLFFSNGKLQLWKNTENKYVLKEKTKLNKQEYIYKILSEIKAVKGKTQEYIDHSKADSVSSFVLQNLKN